MQMPPMMPMMISVSLSLKSSLCSVVMVNMFFSEKWAEYLCLGFRWVQSETVLVSALTCDIMCQRPGT
jgi:hypothetical protein